MAKKLSLEELVRMNPAAEGHRDAVSEALEVVRDLRAAGVIQSGPKTAPLSGKPTIDNAPKPRNRTISLVTSKLPVRA